MSGVPNLVLARYPSVSLIADIPVVVDQHSNLRQTLRGSKFPKFLYYIPETSLMTPPGFAPDTRKGQLSLSSLRGW